MTNISILAEVIASGAFAGVLTSVILFVLLVMAWKLAGGVTHVLKFVVGFTTIVVMMLVERLCERRSV